MPGEGVKLVWGRDSNPAYAVLRVSFTPETGELLQVDSDNPGLSCAGTVEEDSFRGCRGRSSIVCQPQEGLLDRE